MRAAKTANGNGGLVLMFVKDSEQPLGLEGDSAVSRDDRRMCSNHLPLVPAGVLLFCVKEQQSEIVVCGLQYK